MSAVAACPIVDDQPIPSAEPAVTVVETPGHRRWYAPFDLIADRLRVLDRDKAWWVDGRAIAGFPDRMLSLTEVGCRLLHPATPFDARDNAFDWLLDRIHTTSGEIRQERNAVLAGLLLPGLRGSLTPACRRHRMLTAGIEVEALTGLWAAARRTQLGQGRVAARLLWAARRAAGEYLSAERAFRAAAADVTIDQVGSSLAGSMRPAAGHPDLVLAAAVRAGVLLARDAELIALSRIERLDLPEAAARMGLSYSAARQRRSRAETQLVAWLRAQAEPAS
jgi:hypothetical protein